MIVGVPRERKSLEKRVAITPDGARELIKNGHKLLIETNAGAGSHFTDDAYAAVGCSIVATLAEVWNGAELVVKVKEPDPSEYQYFRSDLILFDYLHLASMPDVANALLKGKITSLAYELVQLPDGRLPLLEPMSEVAGKLSVINGSYFLLSQYGGRGLLLGGTIGVPPAEVLIVGAGIAGQAACEVALGMGASVTVIDINYKKLEQIHVRFGSQVRTIHSTRAALERELKQADLLIGAVLIPGASTPRLITRAMVQSMKPGAVIIDISVDQGGFCETIKPTTIDHPVYEEHGVIHYGVCNMPAQTPFTSTMALTAQTLPYIMRIADLGLTKALVKFPELRNSLNTRAGILTNEAVGDSLGLPWKTPQEALSA